MEKVRDRLLRATAALNAAGVAHAVVGGQAVAAWVATVDEAAVRNTRDVDVLLDRVSFDRARRALEDAGFVHKHVAGLDFFLDGLGAKARDAVHVIFAREKVLPAYECAAPDTSEVVAFPGGLPVVSLGALVRMKLTSFRWKDRMHLLDMIDVGLIDETTLAELPPTLAERLRECLANPQG